MTDPWNAMKTSTLALTAALALAACGNANSTKAQLLPISDVINLPTSGDILTPQILTGSAITMGGVALVALAERGLRAGAAKA